MSPYHSQGLLDQDTMLQHKSDVKNVTISRHVNNFLDMKKFKYMHDA